MSDSAGVQRDLRARTAPDAFTRALEAGLASNPPRLLDPHFHIRRGLCLRTALEADELSRAWRVESDLMPGLLAPAPLHHVVALECVMGPGHWLERPGAVADEVTIVHQHADLLRRATERVPPKCRVNPVLADLRESVRHMKLDMRGRRTICWLEGAMAHYAPEVAMHLLPHVGACLGPGDRLAIGMDLSTGGLPPIEAGSHVASWVTQVLTGLADLPQDGWQPEWRREGTVDVLVVERQDGEPWGPKGRPDLRFSGDTAVELHRWHRWSATDLASVVAHARLMEVDQAEQDDYRITILRR